MRAGLAAALVCAALTLVGCTKTMTGTAQPGAASGPQSTTASTTAEPSSAPGDADTPTTVPTARGVMPTRPTPLPSEVSCDYPADPDGAPAAKPAQPPKGGNVATTGTVVVGMGTSIGQLTLTLDRALAPCTVNNFVSLANQGYYDDTPCHRLTTGPGLQVLQCGDPSGNGTGGPGYSFADELFDGMTYSRGTVAMANAGPDTNGSQFFIVYGDASGLQADYTIFGSADDLTLQAIDTVAKAGVQPTNGPGDGAPVVPVTLTTVTVR